MIHIQKDQYVAENENLRVATATGDYEDVALIEFYDIANPDVIAGRFQAQYIRYGGMVYRFNDPKELGAEILLIDPTSTHAAASYVRMSNELLGQMNGGTLESVSLDEVRSVEQAKMEDAIENPPEQAVMTSVDPVSVGEESSEMVTEQGIADTPVPENNEFSIISDIVESPGSVGEVVETVTSTADTLSEVADMVTELVTPSSGS